ncbi:uncharacterized protein [Neodiprion pinetum]|uniref:uncharacterized protein isoform X1 n=1 Tax=Neodiprion pinetum TaxID=441929 RepID=UPI001EDF98E7|nr:uncharacterized protein LOC124214521 isoform X2 [Neodiprion pinetum]
MPYCVASNCKNRSFSKSQKQCEVEVENKVTFHLFPKNIERRRIWLDTIGLTNTSVPKYAYLCSCHFSPESFDRTSAFKVRLKDDAVPNDNAVLQETCSVDRERECSECIEFFLADEVTLYLDAAEPSSSIDQVCESANKRPRIDSPSKDFKQKNVSCQTPQPPRCIDKGTWVSKSLIATSPTKERLRHIIKELMESHRNEIKHLKVTAQRTKKRIATLPYVIGELGKRKDLNLQELDVLIDIGKSNADLLKRVVKKSTHATVPK